MLRLLARQQRRFFFKHCLQPSEEENVWSLIENVIFEWKALINWSNITRSSREESYNGDFVLFVNPSEQNGIYPFVRIAATLWRKRPDIPFLVVEGSSNPHKLGQFRNILSDVDNLRSVKNTNKPYLFYEKSRIAFVPSVFEESFGRVGAESLIAGVPVIGSTRGALPETLGDAAVLLDIPEYITPETKIIPTESDVEPWIDAIVQLWDDDVLRRRMIQKGRSRAQALWERKKIGDLYEQTFRDLYF